VAVAIVVHPIGTSNSSWNNSSSSPVPLAGSLSRLSPFNFVRSP
jgi:hypothetical protein